MNSPTEPPDTYARHHHSWSSAASWKYLPAFGYAHVQWAAHTGNAYRLARARGRDTHMFYGRHIWGMRIVQWAAHMGDAYRRAQ